MIRIAITQAAFDAIARTPALGSVNFENKVNEKGERLVWLDRSVVDRLRAMRGPSESLQRRRYHAAFQYLTRGSGWQSDRLSTRPKRPSPASFCPTIALRFALGQGWQFEGESFL